MTIVLKTVHNIKRVNTSINATEPNFSTSKSPRIILYVQIIESPNENTNYSSGLLPLEMVSKESEKAIIVKIITIKKVLISYMTITINLIK